MNRQFVLYGFVGVAVVLAFAYLKYNSAQGQISGGVVPVKSYCSFTKYLLGKCTSSSGQVNVTEYARADGSLQAPAGMMY